MLSCEVLTKNSRLDCFHAAFSLAASYSLMALLGFLPFLERGSCSSAEVSVASYEHDFPLDLVIDPSEFAATSLLSLGYAILSS